MNSILNENSDAIIILEKTIKTAKITEVQLNEFQDQNNAAEAQIRFCNSSSTKLIGFDLKNDA